MISNIVSRPLQLDSKHSTIKINTYKKVKRQQEEEQVDKKMKIKNEDKQHSNLLLMLVLNLAMAKLLHGNPTYGEPHDNEIDVPPMGTCRQECAGYNVGCSPGYVCCQTGCGHICQKSRCPRIKLTPYPFCLTHCPFQGVENKNLRSFCLCYNACMNVKCAKDEMCIPKQPKCDKGGTCLPLGVCVNINKYTEQGILQLVKGKDFVVTKDTSQTFYTSLER